MRSVSRGLSGVVTIVMIIAATVWGLWLTWIAFFGGRLPIPFAEVYTEGSLVLGFLALFVGVPIIDVIAYWISMVLVMVLTLPFGVAEQFGKKGRPDGDGDESRALPTEPKRNIASPAGSRIEVRTVKYGDDRVVTFFRDGDQVTYRFDGFPGGPDLLLHQDAMEKLTLQQVEARELVWLPDVLERLERNRPEFERKEQERREFVRRRAAAGVPSALSILWNEEGEPIRDPDILVEGSVYGISFDLGVYRGRFHGRRWEGFPEIDRDPDVADWYAFEPAETSEELGLKAGVRFKEEEFDRDRGLVVKLPVSQEQARQVFDAKRVEYRKRAAETTQT